MGVWASAGRKRATRFTAAALVGYGAISTAGLLLFPMDIRGTVESQRDALHIIATIAMSMFIVAVMAFGAFAHGTRFRLYSFATIATVIVFGAWAGILARPMPGPTPLVGSRRASQYLRDDAVGGGLGSLLSARPSSSQHLADRDQCSRLAAALTGKYSALSSEKSAWLSPNRCSQSAGNHP